MNCSTPGFLFFTICHCQFLFFFKLLILYWGTDDQGFPGGSAVKNLPAIQKLQEMQSQSLDQEEPLEEGMATHSVFLPEESHGQRRLAGYSPQGCKESDTTEVTQHVCTNSWLTMLWQFQVNSEGTRPHMYIYPFSFKLSSHPSCHITWSRVSCIIQQVHLLSFSEILMPVFYLQGA